MGLAFDPTLEPDPAALGEVRFGPFRLQPRARLLFREEETVRLGSRALDLLCALVRHPGEVVRKETLFAAAWPGLNVEESSLRFHIAQLRRALGEGQDGLRFVTNIPGRGYCFVAPVEGAPEQDLSVATTAKLDLPSRLPTRPALGRLPHRLARMVGRDDVLAALGEQLLTHRFVTVRGPGGIGKTTAAVAVAHELEADFADGAHFLDLGSLSEASLVPSAVASALGLQVPVDDPTPRLLAALRDRRLLLILDGCEHLIDAVASLAEQIYDEALGVAVLTTSREALQVEGEHVFDLQPLDCPVGDTADPAALLQYAAPQLFLERAIASGFTGELSSTDAGIVAEVCRKLDGVPLAIELVAGRVSAHGLNETAELLDGRLRLAWRGRRTAPARHQSLGAALDWSYELLPAGERRLLALLSVFPGAFTLQGAIAIVGAASPWDAAVEELEQLVAKSLVTARYDQGQASFRLLETTRRYAAHRLAAAGEAGEASQRHADYIVEALTPRSYEPGGERPGGWGRREELLADARVALAWAFSDDGDRNRRTSVAAVCTRLLLELDLLKECALWAQRALQDLEGSSVEHALKVELLWAFGHATMFTDRNSEESGEALRQGRALAERLGDHRNEFRLLSRLHAFYRRTGERRRLLEVSQRAGIVAVELGDHAAIARAQTYIGIAHHLGGNQALAKSALDAGTAGDEAIPDLPIDHFASPRGTNIMSCTNLWLLGLPDQAAELSRRLLDPKANPDLPMYAAGLCFGARVFRWVGDLEGLEEATDRLEACASKHGLAPFLTISDSLRGEAALVRGDIDRGVALLSRTLPRMYEDRFDLYAAAAAGALAEGVAAQGRRAEALSVITDAIARVEFQGESCDMPELMRIRGVLRAQNEPVAASSELQAALELARAHSALSWELRIVMARHRMWGPNHGASEEEEIQTVLAQFSEGFETADLRAARAIVGQRSAVSKAAAPLVLGSAPCLTSPHTA